MPAINVYSLDVDGSLFNDEYRKDMAVFPSIKTVARWVICCNASLIEQVCSDVMVEKPKKVIILNGSARQSQSIDERNRFHKGSFAPALRALALHLQGQLKATPCRLDPYLLSDSYAKVPAGENFAEILIDAARIEKQVDESAVDYFDIAESAYSFGNWVFDESKFSVLYAQMHHVAVAFPNDEICFRFSDDNKLLLARLENFFKANPDLIPANLTLQLRHYKGAEVSTTFTSKGCGLIDYCYEQNLLTMMESIQVSVDNPPDSVDVLLSFDDEFLDQALADFKTKRDAVLTRTGLTPAEIEAIVVKQTAQLNPVCFEDILGEDKAAQFNLEAPRAKQAIQFWPASPTQPKEAQLTQPTTLSSRPS